MNMEGHRGSGQGNTQGSGSGEDMGFKEGNQPRRPAGPGTGLTINNNAHSIGLYLLSPGDYNVRVDSRSLSVGGPEMAESIRQVANFGREGLPISSRPHEPLPIQHQPMEIDSEVSDRSEPTRHVAKKRVRKPSEAAANKNKPKEDVEKKNVAANLSMPELTTDNPAMKKQKVDGDEEDQALPKKKQAPRKRPPPKIKFPFKKKGDPNAPGVLPTSSGNPEVVETSEAGHSADDWKDESTQGHFASDDE